MSSAQRGKIKYDKVQPYKGAVHLENALKENGIDYRLFVGEYSGHGMQNDNRVMKEYMETVEEYLKKYMPVEKQQEVTQK